MAIPLNIRVIRLCDTDDSNIIYDEANLEKPICGYYYSI